jgi:hypothetical protein
MNRICGALLLISIAVPAPAGSAWMQSNRALDIMREVENKLLTESQSYDGAIEVVDAKGKSVSKSWRSWREGNRGSSKILIRFQTPAEVRGVGLLTLNHPNRPAEQWLYTPAIQRDRRIAPQEKSQRFMGTDFTHEDMEERSIEDYQYGLIGDETLDGRPAWKIRAACKDGGNSQYSHLHLWVRKDIPATTLIEYYIGGTLRKTLRWDDWKQVQGVWTPHYAEMKDLARNSTTKLRTANVQYNIRLEADWFTLRNLRRMP